VRDDGFHVDAEELNRHATHVEAVAEQLGFSRSAVAVVRMDRMAYGLLCQVFPAAHYELAEDQSSRLFRLRDRDR